MSYLGPKPKNKKGHKKYDTDVDVFTDGGELNVDGTPVFFINYSPSTPCFYGEEVLELEVVLDNEDEITINVKEIEGIYYTYTPVEIDPE